MLAMGDELGRTQHGNNNAYAQDNALTWVDWASADGALAAFVARSDRAAQAPPGAARRSLAHRRAASTRAAFPMSNGAIRTAASMTGADWTRPDSRALVATLYAAADGRLPPIASRSRSMPATLRST